MPRMTLSHWYPSGSQSEVHRPCSRIIGCLVKCKSPVPNSNLQDTRDPHFEPFEVVLMETNFDENHHPEAMNQWGQERGFSTQNHLSSLTSLWNHVTYGRLNIS